MIPRVGALFAGAVRGGGGVAPVSAATLMLASESQGLALAFTDDAFQSSTGHYGSARVKDTGTPANNYNSHPFGLLTYSSPSLKLCRGPNGLLRYGAHNLFRESGTFDPPWLLFNSSLVATSEVDPFGGVGTVYELDTSGGQFGHIRQEIASIATLDHAFDVWVKAPSSGAATHVRTATNNALAWGTGDGQKVGLTSSWQKLTIAGPIISGTAIRCFIGRQKHEDGSDDPDCIGKVLITRPHLRRLPSDPTYLKTTDAAAYELPYEWDTDGNLLGIRVEEQRSNLFLNNRAPVTQDITVTAQAYTLSFYGTGSITLSGAHSGTLSGAGEDDRVELTFTPSAGTLTCTVSGTIDWVQVEAGSFATSPIETAGSTVTRAADNISLATSAFPFSATKGAFYAKARSPSGIDNYQFILLLSDGTINNLIALDRAPTTTGTAVMKGDRLNVNDGGGVSEVILSSNTAIADNSNVALAAAFAVNDFALARDGSVVATSSSGPVPLINLLTIGNRGDGARAWGGHIKKVVYLPRRMTNTELQEITS